jgi:hypothetical protein
MIKNDASQSPKAKRIFSLAVYCILVIAVALGFFLVRKLIIAQGQLETYVRLAAKAHASINFERRTFYLLAAERAGETTVLSNTTNSLEVKRIPVVSKWDELYIALYNEQMSSLLASPQTPKPGDRTTKDAASTNSNQTVSRPNGE